MGKNKKLFAQTKIKYWLQNTAETALPSTSTVCNLNTMGSRSLLNPYATTVSQNSFFIQFKTRSK